MELPPPLPSQTIASKIPQQQLSSQAGQPSFAASETSTLSSSSMQSSQAGNGQGPSLAAPLPPPSFSAAHPRHTPQPSQPMQAPVTDAAADSILMLASTTVLSLSSKRSVGSMGVPLGALLTPLPVGVPPPPLLPRHPTCCDRCRAFLNLYCRVNPQNGEWVCIFCGHSNEASGALATQSIASCDELRLEAVDYLEADPRAAAAAAAEQQAPTVLAIDITSDAPDLELLKQALLQAIRELPPTTTLALLTFGGSVTVYRLRSSGEEGGLMGSAPPQLVADSYPGHCVPSDAMLRGLFSRAEQYAVPLHSCRSLAEAVITTLQPQHEGQAARGRPRALGVAMEIALYLARGKATPGVAASPMHGVPAAAKGRVLVISTGPTTKGPGYVPLSAIDGDLAPEDAYVEAEPRKYFAWLAEAAAVSGVTVDLFAAGLSAINIPLVGPVASKSGGVLNMQEGFGQLFGANVAAALQRRVGTNGGMDLRVGRGARLVEVIGPAVPVPEVGAKQMGHIYQLNGVERNQGLALLLELQSDAPDDYIHLQVVVGWITEEGAILERCVTRRLLVTPSTEAYLDSIDPVTAALLLAKKVVHEAQRSGAARLKGRAEAIRTAIGRHLYHTAHQMGSCREVAGSGWFAPSRRLWVLPPQLTTLAQALYQLQRGPMLGEVMGHADERALLQSTFLAAAPQLARRMLLPQLYVFNTATGGFDATPAVDLAFFTESALVLDHGTSVFIWLGAGKPLAGGWTQAVLQAAAQGFVAGLAEGRFPLPEVRVALQGTGDARYMGSRLTPIHSDTMAEQLVQYPPLAAISAEARAARFDKLSPTKEPSFLQWCRLYKVDASLGPVDAKSRAAAAASSIKGLAPVASHDRSP